MGDHDPLRRGRAGIEPGADHGRYRGGVTVSSLEDAVPHVAHHVQQVPTEVVMDADSDVLRALARGAAESEVARLLASAGVLRN